MTHVDWSALAQQMGTVRVIDGGRAERGGTAIGYDAVARIVGEDVIVSAVEHHLTYELGSELARSVLMVLRPYVAMERCLEIFRTSEDSETKASAICLLNYISDRRVLEWLPEITSSADPAVRVWAVGVIDQLLIMQNEIELEEAMPFVTALLNDPDAGVGERAGQLMEMIKETYP